MAVVQAEIETGKGIFSGIGDASPANVTAIDTPYLVGTAEVRAKARALRAAVNVGLIAVEELGDSHDEPSKTAARTRSISRESSEPYRTDTPKSAIQKPASANQLATIAKLSRLLGHAEQPSAEMTSTDASERITELSKEYNERKGNGARRSA